MPSEELLVKEAKRRAEVFRNLNRYLRILASVVEQIDDKAEVYLFGSVAEGGHLLSSDIDVLVVTDKSPAEVLKKLWEAGIKDPFEIHVATEEQLKLYKAKAKLTRIK